MENKTLETKFEEEKKNDGKTGGLTKAVLTAVLAGAITVCGCSDTNYDSAAKERAEDQRYRESQAATTTTTGAAGQSGNRGYTPSSSTHFFAWPSTQPGSSSSGGYIPRANNAPSSNFAPKSYSAPMSTYTPVRNTYTPSVSRGGFGAVGRSFGGRGFSV